MSGMAEPLYPFRQTPPVHPAVRSKGLRDRERIGLCRLIDGAHTPQGADAILLEGAPVEALEIVWLGYLFCLHNLYFYTPSSFCPVFGGVSKPSTPGAVRGRFSL